MVIKAYNENHPYLLFIDIEFDNRTLIQFAGLLFKRIDVETYQLAGSYNQYVTAKVCYPFMDYTNITNNFLADNGIPLRDLTLGVMEDFIGHINLRDIEVISHGLKNDRLVLNENGINLSNFTENGKTYPVDGYCTFNNAKRILGRENHLTVNDLCNECGYFLHEAHNAFNDVQAEVAIFTYLKKKEKEKGDNLQ